MPEISVAKKQPRQQPKGKKRNAKEQFAYKLLNYYLLYPSKVPKQTDATFLAFMGKSQSNISKRLAAIFGSDSEFERMYGDMTIVERLLPKRDLARLQSFAQSPNIQAERERLLEIVIQLFEKRNISWEKEIEFLGANSSEE